MSVISRVCRGQPASPGSDWLEFRPKLCNQLFRGDALVRMRFIVPYMFVQLALEVIVWLAAWTRRGCHAVILAFTDSPDKAIVTAA
jgi:hypothetical protein